MDHLDMHLLEKRKSRSKSNLNNISLLPKLINSKSESTLNLNNNINTLEKKKSYNKLSIKIETDRILSESNLSKPKSARPHDDNIKPKSIHFLPSLPTNNTSPLKSILLNKDIPSEYIQEIKPYLIKPVKLDPISLASSYSHKYLPTLENSNTYIKKEKLEISVTPNPIIKSNSSTIDSNISSNFDRSPSPALSIESHYKFDQKKAELLELHLVNNLQPYANLHEKLKIYRDNVVVREALERRVDEIKSEVDYTSQGVRLPKGREEMFPVLSRNKSESTLGIEEKHELAEQKRLHREELKKLAISNKALIEEKQSEQIHKTQQMIEQRNLVKPVDRQEIHIMQAKMNWFKILICCKWMRIISRVVVEDVAARLIQKNFKTYRDVRKEYLKSKCHRIKVLNKSADLVSQFLVDFQFGRRKDLIALMRKANLSGKARKIQRVWRKKYAEILAQRQLLTKYWIKLEHAIIKDCFASYNTANKKSVNNYNSDSNSPNNLNHNHNHRGSTIIVSSPKNQLSSPSNTQKKTFFSPKIFDGPKLSISPSLPLLLPKSPKGDSKLLSDSSCSKTEHLRYDSFCSQGPQDGKISSLLHATKSSNSRSNSFTSEHDNKFTKSSSSEHKIIANTPKSTIKSYFSSGMAPKNNENQFLNTPLFSSIISNHYNDFVSNNLLNQKNPLLKPTGIISLKQQNQLIKDLYNDYRLSDNVRDFAIAEYLRKRRREYSLYFYKTIKDIIEWETTNYVKVEIEKAKHFLVPENEIDVEAIKKKLGCPVIKSFKIMPSWGEMDALIQKHLTIDKLKHSLDIF